MAEFKSKSAKEISAAQMMAEDYRKVWEENVRRADAAEALQLSMAVSSVLVVTFEVRRASRLNFLIAYYH